MKFKIQNLSCGYGEKCVVKGFDAALDDGEILCVLGANGIGKTTLFKSVLGFLKPLGGSVFAEQRELLSLSDKERAKLISYVPQAHTPPFPFKVMDVVIMDRSPHLGLFESPSKRDFAIAEETLDRLGMSAFADKIYTDLSGGERQMVLIARALAQEAKIMMLDEPTANLDFGNQIRVLSEINKLKAAGFIIVMTSHSPEHAFYTGSKVALLMRGKCLYGDAGEIVTSENLKAAYGVDVRVEKVIVDGMEKFVCVPMV